MRFDVTVRQYTFCTLHDSFCEPAPLILFAADFESLIDKLVCLFGEFEDGLQYGGQEVLFFVGLDGETRTQVRIPS